MSILFAKMAGELDTEMKSSEIAVNIDNYRKLVKSYIDLHLYSAALFWADKVIALSNSDPRDIYWLAQCMFLLKQYHRAAHLIRNKGLDKTHVLCHYITVRSLLNAGEFTEALQVLESVDIESCYNNTLNTQEPSAIFEDTPKNKLQSSIMYLKGKVLEAMDNRGLAAECYAQALQYDVHCFEAFEALVQNQMLTAVEEQELIDSLPISQQCAEPEAQILKLLYESKLKKYHTSCAVPDINLAQPIVSKPNFETKTASKVINIGHALDSSTPVQGPAAVKASECKTNLCGTVAKLKTSLDMKVSVAETLYYNCEYRKCIKLTEEILKCDPYHSSCLPVHIACLVELKESNELFYLAHRLVDLYPELAISWFAVGCYYYVIGKSDPARRFLSKATTLDKLFGPAWLAYGHSFAVENEHDQAMAAYFKACQLMKGCHLPLLYIGLECGLTNNEKLAEKFFQQAQCIAPEDPFVMHEMGVISFENRDYATAEKYFKDALARIQNVSKTILTEKWEPLLNNLGHTCRKRKKYQEALEYHQQALVLAPQNPSTYSAIGYVQALMGNAEEAANSFHKTLGLRKNDTFSLTMLKYVMEELLQNSMPYPDAPGDIPTYEYVPPKAKMATDPPDESGDGEQEPMKVVQPEPLQANVTCLSDMSMSFE